MYRPGMHFDALVDAVKKATAPELCELRRLLLKAKLFLFDEVASTRLPDRVDEMDVSRYQNEFYFPFPVMAIEDPSGVAILVSPNDQCTFPADMADLEVYYSYPMPRDEQIIEGLPSSKTEEEHRIWLRENKGVICKLSVASVFFESNDISITGGLVWGATHTSIDVVVSDVENAPKDSELYFLSKVLESIGSVIVINDPVQWVLEERPLNVRPRKGALAKRPTKSAERSIFRILHPGSIRTRMKLPAPAESAVGSKKRGHEVRAHVRMLWNSRYLRNPDGSVRATKVKACWKGPSENTVGNIRYIVRLDL